MWPGTWPVITAVFSTRVSGKFLEISTRRSNKRQREETEGLLPTILWLRDRTTWSRREKKATAVPTDVFSLADLG